MTATELVDAAISNQERPDIVQMYAQLAIAQSLIDLADQMVEINNRLENVIERLTIIADK